MDSFTVAT
jgi:hypothetical protein